MPGRAIPLSQAARLTRAGGITILDHIETSEHDGKTVAKITVDDPQYTYAITVHFTDGTSYTITSCSCCGVWSTDE